jgi:hypothetical protein
MHIDSKDITVVFQGEDLLELQQNIDKTLLALPRAKVIISLLEGKKTIRAYPYPCFHSLDPGVLPGYKYHPKNLVNNVNRQIVTTLHGLQQVKTPYAIKLRSDGFITDDSFLSRYSEYGINKLGTHRIIASSFFTIDPHVFEQMPYHVSDWFHFGPIEMLIALWSTPMMSYEDATYYDRIPHAKMSTYFDRQFRARFSSEQHVILHYAKAKNLDVPNFHNDASAQVISGHKKFLAESFLILSPSEIGLVVPKYQWVETSGFQFLNCIVFQDWMQLAYPEQLNIDQSTQKRLKMKRFFAVFIRKIDALLPMIKRHGLLFLLGYSILFVKYVYITIIHRQGIK